MNNTEFVTEQNKDVYLFSTEVENLMINEFFTSANGDYVKVYLLGLMRAKHGIVEDRNKTANVLGITPDEIDAAWDYWESVGVIRRDYMPDDDSYRVVFLSQISRFYGNKKSGSSANDVGEQESRLVDLDLKHLYDTYESASGRSIPSSDARKIADTVGTFGVAPEVYAYAIKYSSDNGHNDIRYINKVAINWHKEGCNSEADVKALLDKDAKRRYLYSRIFKEIGFNRQWNSGDCEMMDRWFDQFGYNIEEVLEAVKLTAGKREPSLRYVDAVLENKYREAGGIEPSYKSNGKNGNQGSRQMAEKMTAADKAGNLSSDGSVNVSKRVLEEYYAYLREKAVREQKEKQQKLQIEMPVMQKFASIEADIKEKLLAGLGSIGKEKRAELLQRQKELIEQKKEFLVVNGYPEDYLEVKYKCPTCKDHGTMDDGRRCSCVKERADEAYRWNKDRKIK
nr:DnaD domain protein [uncultured Mogibacterium sp.]